MSLRRATGAPPGVSRGGFTLVLIAVTCLVAAYVYHRGLFVRYQNYLEREGEVRTRLDTCRDLQADIRDAQCRVNSLRSDPLEVEAGIRRDKGLVRQGETIYRIEQAPPGHHTPDDPAAPPKR